jgi:hypothetical protein
MVFGDLEEKLARYKVSLSQWQVALANTPELQARLRKLGDDVSEGEDEEDEEEDESVGRGGEVD